MSGRKTIVHKVVMIAALVFAVGALPFSIKACHAAIIILLTAWLLEGAWSSKLAIIKRSLLLQVTIAFFFFQVLGLAFSDSLHSGWFSLEKKIFFLLLPIALATSAIKLNEKEVKWIVVTFILACFAGTLLCIFQAWNQTELFLAGKGHINAYLSSSSYYALNPLQSEKWLFFSYVSLSEGIGIHPTYFSLFLGFSVLFLLQELPVLKPGLIRIAACILILYFSVFVVFLSSRIIILGLSVVFIAMMVRSIVAKQRSIALLVIIVALVFGFLIFLNPVSRYRNLQEINSSTFQIGPHHQYQNAAQIRASLWWLAFKSLNKSDPFFGAGTGDVETAMEESSKQYAVTNIIHSFDPHNQYLYTFLGNGYPGGLLLILCLTLPAYFGWRQKDYLLTGFSFLFGLLCLTESALELQKGIVFYAVFSALLFFQLNSFQAMTLNVPLMSRGSN